ncbi:Integrator complex subunit 3 [Chamberlinius hualienensis]
MEQNKLPPSRLFSTNSVECRDELDEKYEKCYNIVRTMVADVSDTEAHDALSAAVSKGTQAHEEVSLGLMVGILSDPAVSPRFYRDLTFITRDGLNLVLGHVNQLITEKYLKLQDVSRTQLVWLLREMIKNSVLGVDALCYNLLRQIAGGDLSPKNIWLAEAFLDIFIENRLWLDKLPILIATVVYTYLRLIFDHCGPAFSSLQQKETDFTMSLLREKFAECMMIGRDLVRLLQNVGRIPEFEKLWKDIIFNPTSLCPAFTGILQLLCQRTSRRFLQSRLTPDMEKKIVFLTSSVRFGNQKRYQDWFQRQYLSTPESQSLRCDIIRFIVGVIHPTNELLCSDIIPRWAVIGWLLTTCTSNVAASNAKLSLFYDWLFFDHEKDNIMNIEPAILVMHHSLRPHPTITVTLLDFLCRIIPNFYPPLAEKVQQGVFMSLRQILDKRVLPSLSPLFGSPKLDKELRSMISATFAEFCTPENKPEADIANVKDPSEMLVTVENNHVENFNNSHEAEFSDDEDDVPLAKVRLRDLKFKPIKEPPKLESSDLAQYCDALEENIKSCVLKFKLDKDSETKCETIEKLVQIVLEEEEFDQEMAGALASCLCILFTDQFMETVFPQEIDEESIEDSIGSPLFVIFRNLCQMPEEDPSREPILMLLSEMYARQPKVGYRLLYFLKASKINDDKMGTYKDFCKSVDNKDLETCLLNDLRLCQEDDLRLFCYLLPDIYSQFPNIALGNAEILNLIVSCIDSSQLQDLICHILQGNLVMFRKDSFLSVLNASLEWETFEQYCLWQLIAAHNIPVDYIMPILPKLEFTAHAEALTSILLLLKQEKPSVELLKHVMSREVKIQDLFGVSVLRYWSQEHEEKLAELVASQLKFHASPNKRKRQPANKASQTPSVDQMLSHLDQLRQHCKQPSFFNQEILQQALQSVQSMSSETQKTKFSDLFSLAEELEETKVSHTKSRSSGRKQVAQTRQAGNKAKLSMVNSDSSEDNSDVDEVVKPKPTKKRKKAAAVGSDSD